MCRDVSGVPKLEGWDSSSGPLSAAPALQFPTSPVEADVQLSEQELEIRFHT